MLKLLILNPGQSQVFENKILIRLIEPSPKLISAKKLTCPNQVLNNAAKPRKISKPDLDSCNHQKGLHDLEEIIKMIEQGFTASEIAEQGFKIGSCGVPTFHASDFVACIKQGGEPPGYNSKDLKKEQSLQRLIHQFPEHFNALQQPILSTRGSRISRKNILISQYLTGQGFFKLGYKPTDGVMPSIPGTAEFLRSLWNLSFYGVVLNDHDNHNFILNRANDGKLFAIDLEHLKFPLKKDEESDEEARYLLMLLNIASTILCPSKINKLIKTDLTEQDELHKKYILYTALNILGRHDENTFTNFSYDKFLRISSKALSEEQYLEEILEKSSLSERSRKRVKSKVEGLRKKYVSLFFRELNSIPKSTNSD